MPPFRRVESRVAGPNALGILVPQGTRTLVILRPRSLSCDLLPARWDGSPATPPTFCTFDRDEAATVARRLPQSLEAAVGAGTNPVQTAGDARGERHQVWVRADEFVWVVCERSPGKPYHPALFANADQALQIAEKLTSVFWPAAGTFQEYYFNTQLFA